METWKILSDISNFQNSDQILAELLKNRGIKKSEIENFLHPNLEDITLKSVGIDLKEVKKAISRINKAIKNQEQIIIFGDYDVDGICSTTILWETLYDSYKNVFPYIPHREEEGYGLSIPGIKNVLSKYPNCKLIVTVDNGIVAKDAVDFANLSKINVIITDHHAKDKKVPKALALIHTTKICASSISWLFAQEFDKTHKFKNHLELAALATVTDLVPLTSENRIILKFGLEMLKETKRIGLVELFLEAGIDKEKLGTYELGHIIGPRLNASGRITNAIDSLRLLCTKNHAKAREHAYKLGKTNKDRQMITEETFISAKSNFGNKKISSKIVFVSHKEYNQGIIGLVASKLVEKYYRPSFVLSVGEEFSKGSARSISGVNVIELIRSVSSFTLEAGGHSMAAGFTVATSRIQEFKEELERKAEEIITPDLLEKTVRIDLSLNFDHITFDFYDKLETLAPFGIGNPEPVFLTKKVLIQDARLVGANGKHLKLKISNQNQSFSFDAIAFGIGEKSQGLHVGAMIDIVYTINLDTWNGRKKLQLKIRDIKKV